MHTDFAKGTITYGRVWELKASAFYRTFNSMLANEVYVIKHKHDFFDLPIRITEV